MTTRKHPVFDRLRATPGSRPLVVSHRGNSRHHPENTLTAFRSAADLGLAMHEFDVRALRCGTLICIHDASFDRTTDSARLLGPGALVAHTTWEQARQLDAGSWFDAHHRGECLPQLHEALSAMLPNAVPLIEHKAGDVELYAQALFDLDFAERCIFQSFDWRQVRTMRTRAPAVALAALGPNPAFPSLDRAAITTAIECGAGMLHWRARDLSAAAVDSCHQQGLLVCSYTTDDELGWRGGLEIGLDAMCTNDPAAMQRTMRSIENR